MSLALTNGLPGTAAWLVMGLARLDLPFKGGTLVPDFLPPFGLFVPLATAGNGSLPLATLWPAGVPLDTDVFFQYWLLDPAGLVGFSASNALQATTP